MFPSISHGATAVHSFPPSSPVEVPRAANAQTVQISAYPGAVVARAERLLADLLARRNALEARIGQPRWLPEDPEQNQQRVSPVLRARPQDRWIPQTHSTCYLDSALQCLFQDPTVEQRIEQLLGEPSCGPQLRSVLEALQALNPFTRAEDPTLSAYETRQMRELYVQQIRQVLHEREIERGVPAAHQNYLLARQGVSAEVLFDLQDLLFGEPGFSRAWSHLDQAFIEALPVDADRAVIECSIPLDPSADPWKSLSVYGSDGRRRLLVPVGLMIHSSEAESQSGGHYISCVRDLEGIQVICDGGGTASIDHVSDLRAGAEGTRGPIVGGRIRAIFCRVCDQPAAPSSVAESLPQPSLGPQPLANTSAQPAQQNRWTPPRTPTPNRSDSQRAHAQRSLPAAGSGTRWGLLAASGGLLGLLGLICRGPLASLWQRIRTGWNQS